MDEVRFEKVYAEHGRRVIAWCRFATSSAADAEDVAAETFARFLAKGDRIPDAAVVSWLFTVSRRICIDVARRTARESLVDRMDESAAVQDFVDPAWLDPALRAAVGQLTPLQRQVVYLRVIEDLPFAEVARLTGRSVTAARVVHHRALQALVKRMGGTEDAVESAALADG